MHTISFKAHNNRDITYFYFLMKLGLQELEQFAQRDLAISLIAYYLQTHLEFTSLSPQDIKFWSAAKNLKNKDLCLTTTETEFQSNKDNI